MLLLFQNMFITTAFEGDELSAVRFSHEETDTKIAFPKCRMSDGGVQSSLMLMISQGEGHRISMNGRE